jgi:hypothetical protein
MPYLRVHRDLRALVLKTIGLLIQHRLDVVLAQHQGPMLRQNNIFLLDNFCLKFRKTFYLRILHLKMFSGTPVAFPLCSIASTH